MPREWKFWLHIIFQRCNSLYSLITLIGAVHAFLKTFLHRAIIWIDAANNIDAKVARQQMDLSSSDPAWVKIASRTAIKRTLKVGILELWSWFRTESGSTSDQIITKTITSGMNGDIFIKLRRPNSMILWTGAKCRILRIAEN